MLANPLDNLWKRSYAHPIGKSRDPHGLYQEVVVGSCGQKNAGWALSSTVY